MSATAGLTEPEVLAHAKRSLFSDGDEEMYVVSDTQFAKESWLSGGKIDEEVKHTLSPFNHVRVGSGYPDLVGVRNTDHLRGYVLDSSVEPESALLAVEAKGYKTRGNEEATLVARPSRSSLALLSKFRAYLFPV
ncbi:MAG: hypothetical protein U5J64_07740 [Halobacteriales archaeon]|nr:hypothetical protein [Halobacteriales archaeon]